MQAFNLQRRQYHIRMILSHLPTGIIFPQKELLVPSTSYGLSYVLQEWSRATSDPAMWAKWSSSPLESLKLIGSRLLQWNMLSKETRQSIFRKRDEKFSGYYRMQVSLCGCSDVNSLKEETGFPQDPKELRLLTDAQELSLEAFFPLNYILGM